MAKGISVHVGVNATKAPGLNVTALKGCENDAQSMLALARAQGFTGDEEPMIGAQATFENVLGAIRVAAEELQAGDIFLFTFSGHGTRRGAEDPVEVDLKDETLVLRDRLLVDNVLRRSLWPTFRTGVRVVMVSDSCHSGGVAMSRVDFEDSVAPAVAVAGDWSATAARRAGIETEFAVRDIPEFEAQPHFELLNDFYKALREDLPSLPNGDAPPIAANVLLLAACQEHQKTRDGLPHGVFTQALLDVWNEDGPMTYQQLMDGITERLNDATPLMMSIGNSPAFSDTDAFTI